MIERREIVDVYQRLLLRDPCGDDIATLLANAPSGAWLAKEIRSSIEFRTVVDPIRQLLQQEWQSWLFRDPTQSELRVAVDRARGKCGSDDAARSALADGSIRTKLSFRPIKLEMDITNQCNLRCVMCHFSQPSYYAAPRHHLSVDAFSEIAQQVFHRAHQVSLSYGTEPLLHKDIEQLIAILARHDVPHTYMNTNGLLLRESTITAMIEHRFDFLLVSVDAATAQTYEQIRIGGSFAKLIDRLELLRTIKAAHGVTHPRVGLGFVLMRRNLGELSAFVDLAARVGASSVSAMHMVAWEGVGNEPLGANHEKVRCNEAIAAAGRRAAELGIDFVAPGPFVVESGGQKVLADTGQRAQDFGLAEIATPKSTCPFPWSFAAIDPHGEVMPCGWWDARTVGSMGNIHHTDFASIWRGKKFQELRARLLEHRLEGSCARCPAAGMGSPDSANAFSIV